MDTVNLILSLYYDDNSLEQTIKYSIRSSRFANFRFDTALFQSWQPCTTLVIITKSLDSQHWLLQFLANSFAFGIYKFVIIQVLNIY